MEDRPIIRRADPRDAAGIALLSGVLGYPVEAATIAERLGRRCAILGLVVAAGYRGRGVGRRLAEAAARWAKERGLDEMSVRSNVVRAEAHPFYERLGYSRIKTQHAYRKWVGNERGERGRRSP